MSNLASKRVQVESLEYYRLDLPVGYTRKDFLFASREIALFRADFYGFDSLYSEDLEVRAPEIEQIENEDGSLTLRFSGVYSSHGLDLNPLVFEDIVWAEDILAEQDAVAARSKRAEKEVSARKTSDTDATVAEVPVSGVVRVDGQWQAK